MTNVRPKTIISIFLFLHGAWKFAWVAIVAGFVTDIFLTTTGAYRPYIIYIALLNLEFVAMFSSNKNCTQYNKFVTHAMRKLTLLESSTLG